MASRGNIATGLPTTSEREIFQTLSEMRADGATVERIFSDGQASPPGFWYDQDWDEWVLVLKGKAELELEEPAEREILAPGDWLLIPARRRHRVCSTDNGTLWLAIHGKVGMGDAASQ